MVWWGASAVANGLPIKVFLRAPITFCDVVSLIILFLVVFLGLRNAKTP
jgi:hypothetical protein